MQNNVNESVFSLPALQMHADKCVILFLWRSDWVVLASAMWDEVWVAILLESKSWTAWIHIMHKRSIEETEKWHNYVVRPSLGRRQAIFDSLVAI